MQKLFNTWKQYTITLKENACRLKNSLGISREDLPQIDEKNIPKFLEVLKNKKINVLETRIDVSKLKPAQNQLNWEKVETLMNKGLNFLLNGHPIFVSNDNIVIDGHHRYWALNMLDQQADISVYQINLPVYECIHQMRMFKDAYSEDIDEF